MGNKYSANFSEREFSRSGTASRLGIKNKPNKRQSSNISVLCRTILQPVRTWIEKSITISSGFRGYYLNKAINGVTTSQHLCKGSMAAADIQIVSTSTDKLADLKRVFKALASGKLPNGLAISFDQIIWEQKWRNGKLITWIHIGNNAKPSKNRNQVRVHTVGMRGYPLASKEWLEKL